MSTEAKVGTHTPGPWKASKGPDGWAVYAPHGEVALVVEWSPAVDAADARLIAAAPDLLRALKLAQPFVQDAAEAVGDVGFVPSVLRDIEAALARATEQKP